MNIEELRQKPHLSASGVNDYLDCGLLYKFARIDKVKPEFTSDALLFGSAIHKALEEFYKAKMSKQTLPLAQLLQSFESHWNQTVRSTANIQYKEGDDAQSLMIKGKEILSTYYQESPKDGFKVLATELAFAFNLDGLDIPIIGVMDLVEEDGNSLIITDFKTSARAYSSDEVNKSMQLTIYYMAAKQYGFVAQEILLRFDCLIKTKKPKFEQYYAIRTEEDEQRTAKKILSVWEGIQKGVFTPNDSSWKCNGCSYKSHCNQWFRN